MKLMWKLWLWVIVPLVVLAILTGPVWSNHETIPFLKEGMVAIPATCPINSDGVIMKKGIIRVSCTAFIDPEDEEKFYVVIENGAKQAVLCIEVTTKTGAQKIVWRFGDLRI